MKNSVIFLSRLFSMVFAIFIVLAGSFEVKAQNGDIYRLVDLSNPAYTRAQLSNFTIQRYISLHSSMYGYEVDSKVYKFDDLTDLFVQNNCDYNKTIVQLPLVKSAFGILGQASVKGLKVDSVKAIDSNYIKVIFDEAIDRKTVITSNFQILDKYSDSISPIKVSLDSNPKVVNLTLASAIDAIEAPYKLKIEEELKSITGRSVINPISNVEVPLEVPEILSARVTDKNNILISFNREIMDVTSGNDTLDLHITITDLSDSTKKYTINNETKVIDGRINIRINEDLIVGNNYKIEITKFAVTDYFGTKNGALEYKFLANY